jgi:hypothetical protein
MKTAAVALSLEADGTDETFGEVACTLSVDTWRDVFGIGGASLTLECAEARGV